MGWTGSETDNGATILEPANRALELAPNTVTAYIAKAYYMSFAERPSDVIRAAEAGLAINPNSAPLYAARACAENRLALYEQAISDYQQAKRLSPRDPRRPL
jgi:adenylate cyclase